MTKITTDHVLKSNRVLGLAEAAELLFRELAQDAGNESLEAVISVLKESAQEMSDAMSELHGEALLAQFGSRLEVQPK